MTDKQLKAKSMCKQNMLSFNQEQVRAVNNVHTSKRMPRQCEMLMHIHIFECQLWQECINFSQRDQKISSDPGVHFLFFLFNMFMTSWESFNVEIK